jgi:hypothetical protein
MLEARAGSQGGSSQQLSHGLESKERSVQTRESSPEVLQGEEPQQSTQQQRRRQTLDRGSRQGSPEESSSGDTQGGGVPPDVPVALDGALGADSVEPQAAELPAQGTNGSGQQQESSPAPAGTQEAQETSAPAAVGSCDSNDSTTTTLPGRRASNGRSRGRGAAGAAPAAVQQPGGSRLARFLRTRQQEATTAAADGGSASSEVQGAPTTSTFTGRDGGDGSTGTVPHSVSWPAGEAIKNLRAVCEIQAQHWPVLEGFTARWQAYEKKLQGARRRTG